ncbi:MAG: NAD(P)/FAD-dependent oxidoreductase [Bryobacteraceae bacterium]
MTMTMETDIVVAGGGPAGLEAATAAAQAGCRVTMLEQSNQIGTPTRTSGGSFIAEMEALGIPENLYHPVRRCRFVAPERSAVFAYSEPALCVMDVRGVFQFLARRASEAGAAILVGTTAMEPIVNDGAVQGVRAKSQVRKEFAIGSRVVVDATGYRSSILKNTPADPGFKRFGVGAEYDLFAPNYDQDEALLIVGNQTAPAGYAWMLPWGANRVRVGVGVIHPDASARPEAHLEALVENAAIWGADLRGAQPIEYHFGLIPSEGLAKSFVADGILAAGDAAGQASALVGEGIRWAMRAGRMAGAVAAEAVRANDCSARFLRRYEAQWRSEHGKNLSIAYEINKRIASWRDTDWNAGAELLNLLTSEQFAQALASHFLARWTARFLLSNPRLVKTSARKFVSRLWRSASARNET